MYAVNLVINGEEKKAYIGCGDAHKEYLAKQYQVPPKMKEDFAKYKPYKTFFHLTILEEACAIVPHMHEREQWFIENYKGVGTRKKKHGSGLGMTLNSSDRLVQRYKSWLPRR